MPILFTLSCLDVEHTYVSVLMVISVNGALHMIMMSLLDLLSILRQVLILAVNTLLKLITKCALARAEQKLLFLPH